ncbi:hypothetical protein DFJ43DRAFT_1076534 [Lentinula guzmanii]|uniref:Histone deacetylase interacting domain-containing protein n=1 Tax=Lentinula guzmanii TaxID=2804957 RepID=A0AA38JBU9_9AGAR|nr:hypothetical protein DFJ43DRAFT_1076534 [Lentinula guzmanii]
MSAFPTRENSPMARPASHLALGNLTVMPRTPKASTPRPQAEQSIIPGSSSAQLTEMSRPLNVTDALSYLDAVKHQFSEKPEVYNKFLDIMKDFKSQQIDTPGVIGRVSRLFHGNPPLIQGFNTFLPVGYRIDVSGDPLDPNTITVTTPQGTITQTTTQGAVNTHAPRTISQPPRDIPGFGPNLAQSFPFPGINTPSGASPLAPLNSISRSITPQQPFHAPHQSLIFDQIFSPGIQQTQTTAAASLLGNLNNKNPVEKQPQGEEFNHAIQYLNKIKTRYSDDANTYKQFLDILQAYQKEQRHLQDSQVYVQVQVLFKDAPDLLAEFKDFLPEITGGLSHSGSAVMPPGIPLGGPSSQSWSNMNDHAPGSPEKASKKPITSGVKRKKRAVEKEPTPAPPPAKPAPSRAKKPKVVHKGDPGSPSFTSFPLPKSPQLSLVHSAPPLPPIQPQLPPAPSFAPALPMPPTPIKLVFFDRAKKTLENREIYEEFLKLLSLYSKDIIDVKTLLSRAAVFLGEGDLMNEFKEVVGYDSKQDDVENGPPGSIRTGPPEALAAQPSDDGQGPSYRKLPWSEVRLACSGRDELCRSVLNDEWVSHPTWASEEAGFLTLKKNSFEDALHKSEEERHEYHVHLEAMTRTIALLDPLNERIESMTSDERSMYKLPSGLGGPSKGIYTRIIKKVYGRDNGTEIIQALQECPGVAIPVVLARLKQKDDEWRRAHREWSRTWREVDCKNFYKSLDHQGISFKQNDKKCITAKHFVADIESIQAQQLEEIDDLTVRSQSGNEKGKQKAWAPPFALGSLPAQLEFQIQDTDVLNDCLKLVYSFLDRSQGHYSALERRSVEKFLRTFVPTLFMYPVTEFNLACEPHQGVGASTGGNDDLNGTTEVNQGDSFIGSKGGRKVSGQSNGIAAGDLRKKLLKTAKERRRKQERGGSTSAAASRAGSPPFVESRRSSLIPASRQEEDSAATVNEDIWITESSSTGATTMDSTSSEESRSSNCERPFFANTTFYTLFRLLQLLYSRLLMCKEIGQELAATKHVHLLSNPVAVQLGLDDPNGPATVLAQAMGQLNGSANVVYMYLLDACEKVFAGDLDQVSFEEHMRWFFGNKAYHLFTLDKLIIALVKQVQTITSDAKCQDLWALLQSAQVSESITNQDVIRYRREAETNIGQDGHLYRIQWERELKIMRIHMMRQKDASVNSVRKPHSRWRAYVDSWVLRHPTEWIPSQSKEAGPQPFLRRTRQLAENRTITMGGEIRIGISLPQYKIVYERGCDETITVRQKDREILQERARNRNEQGKLFIIRGGNFKNRLKVL